MDSMKKNHGNFFLSLKTTMKILQCGNNFYADYVVVGTGPGGATFDKILTDDLKTSVIGLEAGDYQENDPVIREARFNRIILSDFWPFYG